jgi:PEP-CTERM motif
MSRLLVACAIAALIPVAARGEPISVELGPVVSGFSQSGDLQVVGQRIDLGQLSLGADASGSFFFSNAAEWVDYTVGFDALFRGISGFAVEVLDPMGDGDDDLDPAGQPSYVPAGYSTSNDFDGFSFAQRSGLERSATFAGGSASVLADELTNRGDILIFSGLSGAEEARVTFGLRDSPGGRSFLLRISALAAEADPAPEPASMLLVGTGLAALAVRHRRRRAALEQLPPERRLA